MNPGRKIVAHTIAAIGTPLAALVGGPICGIAFGAIMTVCCRDKHKRRTLCKVMRDSFQWVDETVNLFNDFGDSFYFTTESGFPSNGGLVLFENTCDGHKGLCYQVCT
jgi:hypothetical protein